MVESSGDQAPAWAQNVWGVQALASVGEVHPVTLAFEPLTFSMNIWWRVPLTAFVLLWAVTFWFVQAAAGA
jgi:hypothetical protein